MTGGDLLYAGRLVLELGALQRSAESLRASFAKIGFAFTESDLENAIQEMKSAGRHAASRLAESSRVPIHSEVSL